METTRLKDYAQLLKSSCITRDGAFARFRDHDDGAVGGFVTTF